MLKQIMSRRVSQQWGVAFAASLFAFLVGWIGWGVTGASTPEFQREMAQLFPGWLAEHLRPEPQERMAFLSAVVALPFCWILMRMLLIRRDISDAGGCMDRRVFLTQLLGWVGSLCFAAGGLYVVCLGKTFREYLMTPGWSGAVTMAFSAVGLWFLTSHCKAFEQHRVRLCAVLLSFLPFLLQVFTTRIYFPEYVYYVDRGHFGLLAQTISNSCNGLFSGSQYGYFSYFLQPWFWLFGHSVISISLVMGLLFLFCAGGLIWLWSRFIHNALLIFVGACGFTLVFGSYISLHIGDFDPYFQYHPIRSIGPIAALVWGYAVCAWGTRLRWLIPAGACLAVAGVFWNSDSGVVVTIAMELWLLWRAFCRKNSLEWRAVVLFGAFVVMGILAGVWLCGGRDWLDLFYFQKVFFLSGYYLLPMPLKLHLWVFVLSGYFMLWGWSGWMMYRYPGSRISGLLFLTATLGIGLFLYYQGRSSEGNLISVAWPLFWSIPVLLDRCLRVRRRVGVLLPFRILLIAVLGILFGAYVADFPMTMRLMRQVATRFEERRAEYNEDFAFIQRMAPSDGIANIVGAGQGFFSAQTGVAPAFLPFNQMELATRRDYQVFLENLVASGRPLFLTPRKFVYDWEPPMEFLDRFFELKSVSPSGRIRYYLPRSNHNLQ